MSRSPLPGPSERRAWLGLGGNLGDPAAAMASALRMIDRDPLTRVVKVSSLYRTAPWGKVDQPDFLNAAAEIATTLAPRGLLSLCLEAERALKRERKDRWGPRIIDVDVLMFEGVCLREAGLELPHPRMLERAFVLVPLAEIAPDLVIGGATVAGHAGAIDRQGVEWQNESPDWWKRLGQ